MCQSGKDGYGPECLKITRFNRFKKTWKPFNHKAKDNECKEIKKPFKCRETAGCEWEPFFFIFCEKNCRHRRKTNNKYL